MHTDALPRKHTHTHSAAESSEYIVTRSVLLLAMEYYSLTLGPFPYSCVKTTNTAGLFVKIQ